MRRILSIIVAMAIMMCAMPCGAAGGTVGGDISVTVNGTYVRFDQPPIIQNGRTLVPMRAIFEALGYEVEWNDGSIEVFDQYGDLVLNMWVDKKSMEIYRDGHFNSVVLDVAPQIINSRTLVPVRAISESIGAVVNWNNATRTVTIVFYDDVDDDDENDFDEDDFDDDEECLHERTYQKNSGSVVGYEPVSDTKHEVIQKIETVCLNCGEVVDSDTSSREETHSFKNGKCALCGYVEPVRHPSSGSLDVDDDGNFKTVTLQVGESFSVTNDTAKNFKIQIGGGSEKKRYSYVKYDKNGNISKVDYGVQSYTQIIENGCTLALYNCDEDEITVKAPSDVFFPEDERAFVIKKMEPGDGCRIENHTEKKFSVYIVPQTYGTYMKKATYDYVKYDEDNNAEKTIFNEKSARQTIECGYSLSISNSSEEVFYIFVPSKAADIR